MKHMYPALTIVDDNENLWWRAVNVIVINVLLRKHGASSALIFM